MKKANGLEDLGTRSLATPPNPLLAVSLFQVPKSLVGAFASGTP
jgi:hypothetical protein